MMYDEVLNAIAVRHILDLIKEGQINTSEELRAAYNVIVNKIIFECDNDFDLDAFNKLEAFVKNMPQQTNNTLNEDLPVPTGPGFEEPLGDVDNVRSCNAAKVLPPSMPSTSAARAEIVMPAREIQYGGLVNVPHSRNERLDRSIMRAPQQKRHFQILDEGEKEVKKFNVVAKTLTFKFHDIEGSDNPILWLQNAFDEIIQHVTVGSELSDRIGMILRNDNFPEKPVGFSFRRVDQLSAQVILATLEKILQSNANFFARDTLRLHIDRIRLPTGKGRSRIKMTGVDFEEFCRRKTGILVVNNNDNSCLARALVLAIAWRRNDPNLELLLLGGLLMGDEAAMLCARAGVDLTNGGTREHVQQFQEYLTEHTIIVYNHRMGKTVYFEGPRSQNRVVLNLCLENNHYNVITNLVSAFSCAYFCEMCRIRFNDKKNHKNCVYICPCCHTSPPCNAMLELVKCNMCHRDFRGDRCFNEHRRQLCNSLKRCLKCYCSFWLNPKRPHRCGYKLCITCKQVKPIRHLCYMSKKVVDKKKMDKPFIFVFFDLECRQETPVNGFVNSFYHEPNLCVAQNVCKSCMDIQDMNQNCSKCGKRQHIFKESPIVGFLKYVADLACGGASVTVLAHNMKGYDGVFILRELVKDGSRWNPKIISTGTKLMSITCGNIKFIDSLNFMAMPLSQLPDTFKFACSKGYFPFLFNTAANQNYIGELPPVQYYNPDEMRTKDRDVFLKWHASESEKGGVFDMQREIVKYCTMDVEILRKACLEFWKIFSSQNGVDPFRETCTIAGACMTVFRRNFLQENTIGIIPQGGYRMCDTQSAVAIKWLLWIEHDSGVQIQHAGNGREKRLAENILVDGYAEVTKTVYNFHGCYFHGCIHCYPDQTAELSGVKKESMFMRREATEACASRIRSLGYNLVEMWECRFKDFLTRNPQAAEFVATHAVMNNLPLNPRDAFFGGRTNAVKLYHKAEQDDEEIKYFDVCSLYPFINKYGKYPVGHPKIYVGDNDCRALEFNSINGLIKVTVLPPSNLYHPVLPYRAHNKLMFILCKACAVTMNQNDCNHTQDERKFMGTYVADELQKAVELGYQILEFHEIWSYQVVQYDINTKSGGLFSKYVDAFLKLKQECSGWPSWCVDDETKDRYIDEYLEREGIPLDKNNVSFNAGLRYIAKLILNSFWGKLAQRENLNQTTIISEPYDFFKIMTDPSVDVQSLITPDDNVIIVNWNRPEEAIVPLTTVNVVLAAYTTANARLELYKYLEKLDRRVLYFDTDSVFFTQKSGEWAPPVGDFLGNMTDEIEKDYGQGETKPGHPVTRTGSDRRPDAVREESSRTHQEAQDHHHVDHETDAAHQDSTVSLPAYTGNKKRTSTNVTRSESVKEQSEKRKQRRNISDPLHNTTNETVDLDQQGLTYQTNSGSSSNSSLSSSRSSESPSTSLDAVSGFATTHPAGSGWDSDMEVEADPPDWQSSVPEEELANLHPHEKKRQDVINELFHTERSHLRNLRVLDFVFKKPLQSAKLLKQEDINLIFPNLGDLLEIHSHLNTAMKSKRKESPVVRDIGDMLLNMFDGTMGENFQSSAAAFCERQQLALEFIKERRKKDSRFDGFLSECEKNNLCRRLPLQGIIPTQMQRLSKYPLLLERLIDSEEKNKQREPELAQAELSKLKQAHDRSKEILNYVNEAAKIACNRARLEDIQRHLDTSVFEKTDHTIVNEFKNLDLTRYNLIHEGTMNLRRQGKQSVSLHIVLLEEAVILLQKDAERYVLKFFQVGTTSNHVPQPLAPIIKTSTLLVRANAASKSSLFLVNTSTQNSQMYDLVARDSSERDIWFKHISDAAEAYNRREGKSKRSEPPPDTEETETLQDLPSAERAERAEQVGDATSGGETDSSGPSGESSNRNSDVMDEDKRLSQSDGECVTANEVAGGGLLLKLAADDWPLVQPTEVHVAVLPVHTAEPVLTPIEQIRRKDEEVRRALADKEGLVADLLSIPREDYQLIADIASEVSRNKGSLCDREPSELVLAAIYQANQLITSVNDSLNVSEADAVLATGGKHPSCASNESLVSKQNNHIPSVPVHRLQEIATTLSTQLTTLLSVIKQRDEERERLRKELQRTREQLHEKLSLHGPQNTDADLSTMDSTQSGDLESIEESPTENENN